MDPLEFLTGNVLKVMKLELAFALPAFTGNESKFKMLQADEIWFEEGQIAVFFLKIHLHWNIILIHSYIYIFISRYLLVHILDFYIKPQFLDTD